MPNMSPHMMMVELGKRFDVEIRGPRHNDPRWRVICRERHVGVGHQIHHESIADALWIMWRKLIERDPRAVEGPDVERIGP